MKKHFKNGKSKKSNNWNKWRNEKPKLPWKESNEMKSYWNRKHCIRQRINSHNYKRKAIFHNNLIMNNKDTKVWMKILRKLIKKKSKKEENIHQN